MNPKQFVSSVNKIVAAPDTIKKITENPDTVVLSSEKSSKTDKQTTKVKETYDDIKWLTCC